MSVGIIKGLDRLVAGGLKPGEKSMYTCVSGLVLVLVLVLVIFVRALALAYQALEMATWGLLYQLGELMQQGSLPQPAVCVGGAEASPGPFTSSFSAWPLRHLDWTAVFVGEVRGPPEPLAVCAGHDGR